MVLCWWAMTNRTSPQQIELMVAFMEKHGDLNRAHQNKDRLQLRKLWATLVARLGALTEKGNRPKSLDKWKKTWSDMKNNVKRKAARIAHPELRPPSLMPAGRAAPPLRLSRLDVRVLVVMGLIQRTTSSSLRKVVVSSAGPPAPPLTPQTAVEEPVDTQTYEELDSADADADPLTGIKAEEVEFELERAASDEEFLWPEEPAPGNASNGAGTGGSGGDALQEVELLEDVRLEELEVDEEGEIGEEPQPAVEAAAAAVRPDTRGHTSTRGPAPPRRRAGLRRALAALLRAEARRARAEAVRDAVRARWERDQRATHKVLQRLCVKGLALLERLADRSERDGGGWPPAARAALPGARESEQGQGGGGEEWEEQPLRPHVLHPDRQRP